MAEIPAPKDVGGPAAAPAQPFTRYREWPPAKACGAAPLIDRADLRVQRLDGLHQALSSGAIAAAAARFGATAPGLGLFADSPQPHCAVRIARDRLLLVGPEPLAAEPGWQPEGFALTPIDDGLAAYALTGAAVPALLRLGTAIDPNATSPCAAMLFAGFAVVAYRCQGVLRIHLEASLTTAFEAWLRQATTDLPSNPGRVPT